jgi:hypothetical protein
MHESSHGNDAALVGAMSGVADAGRWRADWRLDKYDGEVTPEQIDAGLADLIESIDLPGNILVTAGITLMLNLLIGAGGTVYSNANAYLGAGDSSTAAAIGQTDLQAATNKLRKAMDSTYPSVATNVLTARSTFATTDANYAWEEVALFNAAAAGTMLNRKVGSLGTKTSAATWVLTLTITIS